MNSEANSRPGAAHKIFKRWQLIDLFREEGEEPLVCLKEEEALTKLANFLAKFNDLVSDIFVIIISHYDLAGGFNNNNNNNRWF